MVIRALAVLALSMLIQTHASASDLEPWPPKLTFNDASELSLTGNFAYDSVAFHGDDGYGTSATALDDTTRWRRKEFGVNLKKKDHYDLAVAYDFHAKNWLDVALRVYTKALFDRDFGRIRIGYFKTPVGMEAVTATRTLSMLELSSASQAIFEGRRTGVEWSLEQADYLASIGYFFGNDLQGDNPGTTAAGKLVWTPGKQSGQVLHFGLAGSIEHPDGHTDGRGTYWPASTRLRSRPQSGLTDVRLVDSGPLTQARRVTRIGLEQLWIHGSWSVQSEYLRQTVNRGGGQPDFSGHGGYLMGSWVVTGEARQYSNGGPGNVIPARPYGALEFLLRYGTLDLDDGAVAGGRQRDLTFGANWYVTRYFKLQGNYVRLRADRMQSSADLDLLEMRAQFQF